MGVIKICCFSVALTALLSAFWSGTHGFMVRNTQDCPRTADIVAGWYHTCSRRVFYNYNQLAAGQTPTGQHFIQSLEAYCSHECEVYDCLKSRYNVNACSDVWQDEFYSGVLKAESVCNGMRLLPAVRQMLTNLSLDTNDRRWAQCSQGAFPSISQCNAQLRESMSNKLGVESFWLSVTELDFVLSSAHVEDYLTSLTSCVYQRSTDSGCDPRWAKLVAVIALERHNSPFNYGVNTTHLLDGIGQHAFQLY